MESFIVKWSRQILNILAWISILALIRKFFIKDPKKKKSPAIPEIYVLANFVFQITCLGAFAIFQIQWWMYVVLFFCRSSHF